MNNDYEVSMFVGELDKIFDVAGHLTNFVEDHGGMEPDGIVMGDVSRLSFALISLRAACEILGIDLTQEAK